MQACVIFNLTLSYVWLNVVFIVNDVVIAININIIILIVLFCRQLLACVYIKCFFENVCCVICVWYFSKVVFYVIISYEQTMFFCCSAYVQNVFLKLYSLHCCRMNFAFILIILIVSLVVASEVHILLPLHKS